jgi:hypothetical protein
MRRNAMTKRFAATETALQRCPLAPEAVSEIYSSFLQTGALPNDRRLSWAVLERALHARKASADTRARQSKWDRLHERPNEDARYMVFREAIHQDPAPRDFARILIRLLVRSGDDPTDPEFVPPDLEHPEFGSLAMHALGWPDLWAREPYAKQMQRVLVQHAALRAQGPRSDLWYHMAAAALAGFLLRGHLPEDDAECLFALTLGEMFAIHADYFGHGDEELLAAFDAVARANGAKREAAMRHLGAMQAKSQEGG